MTKDQTTTVNEQRTEDAERDRPALLHDTGDRQDATQPHRRRRWVRPVGVGLLVVLVLLAWPTWSIVGALTAPGTDSTAARLAEWARFNHLGWAVTGLEQAQYNANPPKVGGALAGGIPGTSALGALSGHPALRSSHPARRSGIKSPTSVPSQARPSLRGEGLWQPLVTLKGEPAIRGAFLRPDAQHTSFLVGVAWINQKLVRLVLHPGYKVPGGYGLSQPSEVSNRQRNSLVATFNSGFTMVDANGGYWQDGKTVVPLRTGAASMVFYKDGHVDVVSWRGAPPGPDVAAVRQNLGLLVDHGTINPDVDSTTTSMWGATLGNKTYVWRSALGVRKDGSLVFVVGASMSVRTLANVVHDAGAVRAVELDINPQWTNFITYTHPSKGVAVPKMLTSDEQPNPYRYLQPSSRDFIAVLAR